MDRDIPTFNRSVMQRIYSKNHELHLRRLKDIKSGITSHKSYTKPTYHNLTNSNSLIPPTHPSKLPQYHNPKRQSIEEMNSTKIERENALLFKKMLKIMKRPDKNNDPTAVRYSSVTGNAARQRMSMEFSRINEENKTLFQRLEQQKPTIDMKKLEEERVKNLQILKFLGKYPNQQAMLRASQQQFHTFDLKSRKMNSTSNRIYYNNLNRQHNHQGGQQLGVQQRFRNQMEGYDRELRELKDETRRAATNNSRTIEKFTVTSGGGYYNPRRVGNSGNHQNDTSYDTGNNTYHHYKEHYTNNQLGSHYNNNNYNNPTTLSPDQPIPPARRKFLSQGGHRQTAYDPRVKQPLLYEPMNTHLGHINENNYDEEVIDNGQGEEEARELEKYPYHLNHPSNNIVIQDRLQNYYNSNSNKRKTLQNVREKKGISNNHTYSANTNNTNNYTGINTHTGYSKNPAHQPLKPSIPKPYLPAKNTSQNNNLQRKLNKKNSQSHIQQQPEHVEAQPKPQFNILPEQFYHESMQEQDEEDFETEPSPQRVGKNNGNVLSNAVGLKNVQQGYHIKSVKNEQNMILLYKTSIQLGKLMVKQQVDEIKNDINEYIIKDNNSSINAHHQSITKCIISLLSQQLRQLSIHRLPQCYKITISNHNPRLINQTKKKRYQQHSSKNHQEHENDLNINQLQQLDPSILQIVRKYLQNALASVEELEIPEEEGSLLLEDIDYNYKHFIRNMVKVEKDAQENGNQEGGMSQQPFYRLVIVFDDEQEAKEESRENQLGNNNNHQQNYQSSQNPIIKQQNKQLSIHDNPPENIPKDPQNTPHLIKPSQSPTKQTRQNPDSDEQQTLSKPQAVSSNIPTGINPNELKNHEKSIYVEALDQQVM